MQNEKDNNNQRNKKDFKIIVVKLKDLIELGYIPAEVVPVISTKKYSKICSLLLNSNLKKIGPKESCCSEYNIPRIKNLRRHLGIPNPLHQFLLSQIIASNWSDIDSYISKSKLSFSKPVIDLKKMRSLKCLYDLGELPFKSNLIKYNNKYTLKTDVSRYYPTIYTHSIPWALHSKPKSKKNRIGNILGNQIDLAVRNTTDGQTIGIPIGPDTSLVIAEIIGAAMDSEIILRMKRIKGFRYIDDYELFFKTISQAEQAKYNIYNIMRDYELECNPRKTEVIESPELLEKNWVRELKFFRFRSKYTEENDLLSFFSIANKLSKEFPDEPILKYALARIKSHYISEKNWKIYEAFILKTILIEPSVLKIAVDIFKAYKSLNYKFNKRKISSIVTETIKLYSKYKYSYELSWILYLSKILNLKVSKEAASELQKVDDPIVVLISLDLINCKLLSSGIDTTLWESYMNEDNLYTEYWLLAYEAMKKNWLKPMNGKNYIKSDKFFSILDNNNIDFYDSNIFTKQLKLKYISTSGISNDVSYFS